MDDATEARQIEQQAALMLAPLGRLERARGRDLLAALEARYRLQSEILHAGPFGAIVREAERRAISILRDELIRRLDSAQARKARKSRAARK